jgi:hypothetical protein
MHKVAWDEITGLAICFSMCDVWLSTGIIQHNNTQTTTLTDYGLGYQWSLDFVDPLSLTP